MPDLIENGAWTPEKVEAVKTAFYEFLKFVVINSKDTGGLTHLSDHVYYAQQRFLDSAFDGLGEDIHDFKVLKSRQLGISTISRALALFWMGIHPGLQGAMIFDTDSNKEVARSEIKTILENMPVGFGFPGLKSENRTGLRLKNDSFLRFMSAGVRSNRSSGTLGRSSGINMVWASEMCSWNNPEGIVSLRQSLSDKYTNRLYIWESTARGFNDWYRMWQDAKNDVLTQRTVFIGWWAREDQRFKVGTKAFDLYGTEPPTDNELERIAQVREQYGFDVDQEQLAWYRWKSNPIVGDDDDMEGDEDNGYLQQDQPWTEEEAFIQTGSTFFPPDKLTLITKTSVSDSYKPYYFVPSDEFVYMQVHPSPNRRMTQLKVWEEPEEGGHYIVSGDPAFGHNENNDRSACQVLRCYADCAEQVAEFASPNFQPHQFAWVMMSLAGWYKNSRLIVELNGPGEAVLREMQQLPRSIKQGHLRPVADELGISNIFTNVRHYIYTKTDSMSTGHVLHLKTNSALKVTIMERCRDFASTGRLIIHSRDLVDEMKTIRRDGDKIEAEASNKDDRVFSMAMGLRGWEQSELPALIAQGKTREVEQAKKRFTLADQMAMMNKMQLQSFFKRKVSERRNYAAELRRNSWKYR